MTSVSVGSVVAGYRIEEVVARGGMGVVYRVTHVALERERALKLIAPELAADESFKTRFRREWKVAASIDHPHAIPIHDAGEADGLLYIVMRYVQGTDLRRMSRDGPLATDVAATIVNQVAGALDAAHSRGLVHRDIKPANILVELRDGGPHAYLTDFGLTKHMASTVQLTDEGRWVGTVDYVAPEQIEGKAVDARTDIYGLGCVAYNVLTGEVPFPRDSDVAKIWAHLSEPPPMLAEHAPDLPATLEKVVMRAMAKKPEERFLSAGDLGRAMLAATRGEIYTGPERSVARGEAARGGTVTRAATRPARGRIRARRGREYMRVASVSVMLSLLFAIAVIAVALRDDGGGGDVVRARQPLVAYQSEVGQICDELNKVNKASVRRARAYRKRLRSAKDLQALRDAVVDETVYTIRVSSNLSSRTAGLIPPSTQLARTQRATVESWRRNVSRRQAYRDRLKRVRSYQDLRREVTKFDSRQRTVMERSSASTTEGLHRLGGPACEIDVPPSINAIPLPPNPDAPPASDDQDLPDSSSAPSSDAGLAAPVTSAPAPDATAPSPDATQPSPDASPAPPVSGGGDG